MVIHEVEDAGAVRTICGLLGAFIRAGGVLDAEGVDVADGRTELLGVEVSDSVVEAVPESVPESDVLADDE